MKENKTGKNIYTYSCIEKINIVKMIMLLKAIYRFTAIPKVPMAFFTEIEQKF